MKSLRVALAQINPTVGDLSGNAGKIKDYIARARKLGAEVVVFPELSITGYPPEDLLLKPQFIADNMKALDSVCRDTKGITAIVGFVHRTGDIYNAAAVISDGKLVDVYHKAYLPNYGPFDEFRYFQAGNRYPVYKLGDVPFGVSICEDIWYPDGPPTVLALAGAEIIFNINASPYTVGKNAIREKMLCTRAVDSAAVLVYMNMVGGQDELVFDGASMVVDERGQVLMRCPQFEEDLAVCDVDLEAVFMRRLHDPRRRQQALGLSDERLDSIELSRPRAGRRPLKPPKSAHKELGKDEEVYSALTLGVRDYVGKNGFKGVFIGLSGGVDSSLVAALAVDAIGRKNVKGILMPSPFTSPESTEDALELAKNLGIKVTEIPIDEIFIAYLNALKKSFKGRRPGTAEENLQARIRGSILMGLSNKFGWIVLTTGNKSEMSVGYATLYGDMAGGFAAIKDVSKTMVYDLARWRNTQPAGPAIPERVLTKEPSAELHHNQKDTDTLPPYDVLDPVLKDYVERDRSFEEIVSPECPRKCAQEIISMIDRSEYKRRQAPPGIKITPRAFGKDRRFPITNKYKSY